MTGETVSRYRILEKLGEGGMGAVYKAEDTSLGRVVAVKFLAAHLLDSDEHKQRLLREAKVAGSLEHPNICAVHDVGESAGRTFVAMSYVEGVDLRTKIGERPLKLDAALDIAIQAAEGLRAAHHSGVVHRDVKSANLMITGAGQVKILDFGLAQLGEGTRLTRTGTVLGTPAYMAPEQAQRLAVDRRADIWSLGVVLYEMVTGRLPFEGEGEMAVMYAIVHRAHEPVTALRAGLPVELDRVLAKALAKNAAERYQHMDDMLVDLRALRRGGQGTPTAARPAGRTGWKWAGVAAAALACAAAGYYYASRRGPALSAQDTIVLADFENSTGDPVFDGTLRQGLAVQLAQSPFLSIVSEQRVQRSLRTMERPADTRLTPEVAREVCERTGGYAVLEGSIARLGGDYVLGLRARNCATGDVFDQNQRQVARKEDVLNALGELAARFRARAGESRDTIEKHATPLVEATTPSLDALKAYTTGWLMRGLAGLPHFQRAVEIDPNFAMAHAALGLQYSTRGESALAAQSTTRAYQLRSRASDRERFFITLTYNRQVTGNLEKAFQTADLLAQTYPRDADAHALVAGFSTAGTGRHERRIEESRKAMALDPDHRFAHMNIVDALIHLGRFPEAAEALRQAAARHLDGPDLLLARFHLAFFANDAAAMSSAAARAQGVPVEEMLLHLQGLVLARSGKVREAGRLAARAARLSKQTGKAEIAATYLGAQALTEAVFGAAVEAKRTLRAAQSGVAGRDAAYAFALAFGLAGDSTRSRAIANDLATRFPEDTGVQFNYLPALRALEALNRRDPRGALQALETASAYETAVPAIAFNSYFAGVYPVYFRGMAHLDAGDGVAAAAEFRKVVERRGLTLADPLGSVAQWRLGQALAKSGDASGANEAFRRVIELWREADGDLPLIRQARAEYAAATPRPVSHAPSRVERVAP